MKFLWHSRHLNHSLISPNQSRIHVSIWHVCTTLFVVSILSYIQQTEIKYCLISKSNCTATCWRLYVYCILYHLIRQMNHYHCYPLLSWQSVYAYDVYISTSSLICIIIKRIIFCILCRIVSSTISYRS